MASTCSSCGKPMIWKKTPAGKRMPLDPTPSDAGNVMLDSADQAVVITHDVTKMAVLGRGGKLYTSHFATCPDAARHRKARS